MSFRFLLVLLSVWLWTCDWSGAQSYNFDFYSVEEALSSQPNWSSTDTNDPLDRPDGVAVDAQTGGHFFINNSSNNIVGILGGFLVPDLTPADTTTLLSASVTATPSTSNPILRFRWAQNILNAQADDGVRDRFGWTIRKTNTNSVTSDLVALMFDPKNMITEEASDNNSLLARAYNGSPANLADAINTGSVQNLSRGAPYSFEILLDTSANLWSARVGISPDYLNTTWSTIIQNATLGLSSGDVVSQFSATWILEAGNPSGAGENVMAFDNIQIDAVPEPSSLSLVTLGSLALLAARRRRS